MLPAVDGDDAQIEPTDPSSDLTAETDTDDGMTIEVATLADDAGIGVTAPASVSPPAEMDAGAIPQSDMDAGTLDVSDGANLSVLDNDASDAATVLDADAAIADCVNSPERMSWRALSGARGTTDAAVCVPSQAGCALIPCAASECADAGLSAADGGVPWPTREIPICFTAATASRTDFDALVIKIWDHVTSSWPAVADVEFTGWAVCPDGGARGVVPVDALPDLRAGAQTIGARGDETRHTPLELGSGRADFDASLIPHELGHLLGFAHELARSPASNEPAVHCTAKPDAAVAGALPGADIDSIMVDTNDCTSQSMLSRSDIVNVRARYGQRADNVIATGNALYARKRSTGDIYALEGPGWSRISGPVGQLAAVDTKLYALTTDLSEVLEYSGSGTRWTPIGYEGREIMACASDLCVTLPNGDFARYRSGTWTRIGGPATKYVATSSAIYRLTLGRYEVEVYSETDRRWYGIGNDAGTLYATSTMLLASNPIFGDIYRYTGQGSAWEVIGLLGRLFIGDGKDLYALAPLHDAVQRYTGSGYAWTIIGGRADWLYSGPNALYMTEPETKDILRYNGQVWERVGQP